MNPQLCCLVIWQGSYILLSLFMGDEVDCSNRAFVVFNVVLGNFDGEDNRCAHGVASDQWTPSEHASGDERIAVGGGRRNNPRAAHETPRASAARMVLVPHGWCGSNDANE